MVEQIAIRLDETRRSEFRRFVVVSLVVHCVVFVLLAWSPSSSRISAPASIAVSLVAPPGMAPAAAPAPKPAPKPPKPAPVILPKEASVPKPVAKPAEKPKPAPPKPAPEPKEVDYDDLMAQLREEAGAGAAAEPAPAQTAAIQGGGGGPGRPVSPELAAWLRDARIHVRRSWVVPPAFEMETLVVELRVDLDASGNVRGTPQVSRRSGNPWYDENVIRSIQKSSPLPAPPEAGTWTFVFYSDREA